jgi:hypothetical protein
VLNEFYRAAFRRKIYRALEELQSDLDHSLRKYNEVRPHQGRWCHGNTPLQIFADSIALASEKMLSSSSSRRPRPKADDHEWLCGAAVATATT